MALLHERENNEKSEGHLKNNGQKFSRHCNMEIWRDVLGFEGVYEVSSLGRIKRNRDIKIYCKKKIIGTKKKEQILSNKSTVGYPSVTLSVNGKRLSTHIHRLVAKAFIDNPENKPCVNHKNGVKTDNRVENLEWVTYLENEKHSKEKLGKKTPVFQLMNLTNYSKEWDSPITIGNLNIRSTIKKMLYMLLCKGVTGKELTLCGVKRGTLVDIIRGLEENGVTIKKEIIFAQNGKSSRVKLYKIIN